MLLNSIRAYRRASHAWADEYGISEDAIWAIGHGRRAIDIIRCTAPGLDDQAAVHRIEDLIGVEYERVRAVPGRVICWSGFLRCGRWSPLVVVPWCSRRFTGRACQCPASASTVLTYRWANPIRPAIGWPRNALGWIRGPCVVVEDAPTGVAAGKAAGMAVIAVTTTYAAVQLQDADLVVSSLREVADAVSHLTD